MLRNYDILTASVNAHRSKMNLITNNIANIDTVGYKKDRMAATNFHDVLLQVNNPYNLPTTRVTGAQSFPVYQANTDYTQGNVESTGRSADLMLQGAGFFAITTPDGERYTRNGNFFVSSAGYLTDSLGNPVAGTTGNIQVGSDDFTVDEQGNVMVNGQAVNRLRIVSFADTAALTKVGDNLYASAAQPAAMPAGTTVLQGNLESSNVDIATEMVDMMEASRAYNTSLQLLNMMDTSLGKAVNDVGRV